MIQTELDILCLQYYFYTTFNLHNCGRREGMRHCLMPKSCYMSNNATLGPKQGLAAGAWIKSPSSIKTSNLTKLQDLVEVLDTLETIFQYSVIFPQHMQFACSPSFCFGLVFDFCFSFSKAKVQPILANFAPLVCTLIFFFLIR